MKLRLRRLSGGEDAGAVGEVVHYPHVAETSGRRYARSIIEARLVKLESASAARLERHGAPIDEATEQIEAIGPAIERKRGLELRHFARQVGKHPRRNIGRVGND